MSTLIHLDARLIIVLVAFVLGSCVQSRHAQPDHPPSHPTEKEETFLPPHHHEIRQFPAADPGLAFDAYSTTTSSFNWWPYPPGGVQTTTSSSTIAAVQPIQTVPMPVVQPQPSMQAFTLPSDQPFFFSPPMSASSVASTAGPVSAAPLVNATSMQSSSMCPSSTSCAASFSTSSTTTSPTVVDISALPPRPTPVPSPHSFPKQHATSSLPFSHIRTIIISVCAVVGVIVGSVIAWFCYGCYMTRRRRMGGPRRWRNAELEVGPEYSTEGIDAEKSPDWSRETVRAMASHPMTGDTTNFSWDIPRSHEEVQLDVGEDQALLAPPSRSQTIRTTRSAKPSSKSARAMRRNTTKSVYSTVTGFTASPDPLTLLSDEEEEDAEALVGHQRAYESLRKGNRTIRRELLSRVQEDHRPCSRVGNEARRRVSHTRADSDLCLDDHRKEKPLPQEPVLDPGSTQWMPGSGFRIVTEDAKSILGAVGEWASHRSGGSTSNGTSSAKERNTNIVSSWLGKRAEEEEDKFTPVPVRKSPTKPQRKRLQRVDSSLLPMNPAQIMSPPLESQLFFAPSMSQAPSLESPPTVSPERRGTRPKSHKREGRSLRGSKPPPMPFPAGARADEVYRGRLVKGQPRSKLESPEGAGHSRLHRRDPVFNQVSRIVRESRGERDADSIAAEVGSPNGFGAQSCI